MTVLGLTFIALALIGFASDRLAQTTEHPDMATAASTSAPSGHTDDKLSE